MDIKKLLEQHGIIKDDKYFASPRRGRKELLAKLAAEHQLLLKGPFNQAAIVFCLLNNIRGGECLVCKKPTSFKKDHFVQFCSIQCVAIGTREIKKETCLKRYGVSSPLKLPQARQNLAALPAEDRARSIEKRKNTNINKYGGPAPLCSKEVLEKAQQTNLDRYGHVNSFHSPVTKQTVIARYGVDHFSQIPEVNERRKQTCLDRFGSEFPFQSSEIREKGKNTLVELYGKENPFMIFQDKIVKSRFENYKNEHFEEKLKRIYEEYGSVFESDLNIYLGEAHEYEWSHSCGYRWKQHLFSSAARCPRCFAVSKPQYELTEFIQSLGFENARSNRKVLGGLEIDCYLEDKKIGFELNGCFWHGHSLSRSPKRELLEKTVLAEQAGVQLVHVWDFEWTQQNILVKSRIKSILGKNEINVNARECLLKEVSVTEANKFLNENHLQGVAKSEIRFGLYKNDELVSLMTFSRSRFSKKFDLELVRFCCKCNTTVRGAASRLLTRLRRLHPRKKLISYCDRGWSQGDFYKNLGFKLLKITQPGYFWVKNDEVLSRYETQLKKLPQLLGDSYIANCPETENMMRAGWIKCYNVGHHCFLLET